MKACRLILLLLIVSVMTDSSVRAQSISRATPSSSFSISSLNSDSPSMFVKDVKPGDKVEVKVRVRNIGKEEKDFVIYPTDVLPALRGGWFYKPSTDKPKLMGTWLSGSPHKEKLKVGTSKDFKYVMTVPKDIADGQYIGAIVSEEFIAANMPAPGDKMATVTDEYMRVPLQVVLNINKDKSRHSVRIGQLFHESQGNGLVTVYVPHINEGTILEKPSGKLTLRNSGNKVILRESYQMESVYVGTTGLYDLKITQMLLPDTYTLAYEVDTSSGLLKGEYKFEVTTSNFMTSMDSAENVGDAYDLGIWTFLRKYWIWIFVVITIIITLLIVLIIILRKGRKKDEKEERRNKPKRREPSPFDYQ